jgi:hypothetical protein
VRAIPMRLHAFTELAKRKGCEVCVWYSEHFSGLLLKIHIKSYSCILVVQLSRAKKLSVAQGSIIQQL